MDTLIRVLVVVTVLLMLSKLFGAALGQGFLNLFFGTKKKKNSDMDFDYLIEQKKSMLRGDSTPTVQEALNKKRERKGRSEEALHNEYQNLSKENQKSSAHSQRLEELKKIIAIYDSFQWGAGPEIKELANLISQKTGERVADELVSKSFKILSDRELFLTPSQKILSLVQIKKTIETFIFLQGLGSGDQRFILLSKRWTMTPDSVKKGFAVYLTVMKKGNKERKITELLKQGASSLAPLDTLKIISLMKPAGNLLELQDILSNIREEAELFHALSPLSPLKGNSDIQGAYKSLGLSSNASVEQIKKQYKKLAQLKHPDRLKGKGIPAKFESIATENFTQIKQAYDILMKKEKGS